MGRGADAGGMEEVGGRPAFYGGGELRREWEVASRHSVNDEPAGYE